MDDSDEVKGEDRLGDEEETAPEPTDMAECDDENECVEKDIVEPSFESTERDLS
jgi:hypothetical protein